MNNLNTGDDFTVSVTADNTWSSSATMYLICNFYNSSGSMLSGGFVQSPDEAYRKKTIKISDEHFGMAVYLIVYNGKTINNVTVKPMIEKGVDVTEYEPYGYKIPITVGGKNLLDLPEKFTFESFESKKVNIPAGQYTVSWTSSILGGTYSPTLRLPDNAKSFPFAASSGSWKVTLTKPETIVYFYSNGYSLNDSTGVTSTVNGLMLELGEAATEYEPYKEPQTTNIFLNAPLGIGESIDYKTDNLPDIFVSEGTNIISAETEVKPSAIEVKYRSSIEEG